MRQLTMQEFLECVRFGDHPEKGAGVQVATLDGEVLGEVDVAGEDPKVLPQVIAYFKQQVIRSFGPYTRTVMLLTKCGCKRFMNLADNRVNLWQVPIAERSRIVTKTDFTVNSSRKFAFKGRADDQSGCRILEEE